MKLSAIPIGAAILLVACNAIAPGLQFLECVWASYQADPTGTPLPTVITTAIAACGGDAVSVVRALDDKEPHRLHATKAHETVPAASASSSFVYAPAPLF